MKAAQYFEINKTRRDWLGVRFFKWLPSRGEVIQIVAASGEQRRGRANNFGIYTITQMSFMSNYLAMGYAVPCKESVYQKAFKIVLSSLK